ncbi:DUF3293 domain-containing protein [Deinococcus hohokamensis]|uniref:DUF3293 domain-containing protein n=1 Tax=Deinococcus hohokamensis TaxID=309883 RepID=A0ABV9I4S6_9DEIO
MTLRRAFLDTTYGPRHERFRLSPTPPAPGQGPSWVWPGQRWALITAWNPGGLRQPPAVNHTAQARLQAATRAWPQQPAVNGHGEWAEPALLLLGLPLPEALRLGRAFGQAAVLFGTGLRVALVWLPTGAEGDHGERPWAERYWAVTTPPTSPGACIL